MASDLSPAKKSKSKCEFQPETCRKGAGMNMNYTKKQIIKILKEHEAGSTVTQICHKHDQHVNTLYLTNPGAPVDP